ncbi:hypothetical protein J5X84_40710 [Streptosporangiaceae bacterium NEAU-GS5]|nr:hypothetical protein [Streptosporangiaceae bacterium NEAU-GS5]
MPRTVIPGLFVLRLATLDKAAAAGRVLEVEKEFGPLLRKREFDTHEPGNPVSLRWTCHPVLGFPRVPFTVWRRTRKEEPGFAILGGATPKAPVTATLPNEVIEIRFDAVPAANGALTVQALARNGHVLPRQRLTFTASHSGRFRAAGIAALKLSGDGHIQNVAAIVQRTWANLPDWQHIETVGFPFEAGDPPQPFYDSKAPQGWTVPSLSAQEAARVRLAVARILQLEPPPVGAGGIIPPAWPFPGAAGFLGALNAGPLDDIIDCLVNSDDADPQRRQALHVVSRALPGIGQIGQPPGPDPATLRLPTTAYVSLAVQDSPAAVGLGFGTADIPEIIQPYSPGKDVLPPGVLLGRHEYLVSAPFTLPFGVTVEFAAIGHLTPAPTPFSGLTVEPSFPNRALQRDGEESLSVRLSWAMTTDNLGAGLLSQRPPGGTITLNTPRPAGIGGFQPYLTQHALGPDGGPLATLRSEVTLPDEPVPTSGSSTTSYAVAPIDVHGRWGPWNLTNHTATARPVQRPGLDGVTISMPAPLPGSGPVATPCALTVEVSWDWADRSCHRIEISGAFVPPGPLPDPPPVLTGLQRSNTPAAGPALVVTFSPSGVPSIPSPATVAEVHPPIDPAAPPPSGAAGDVRRYRVTLPGSTLDFGAADELSYAVSARGAEAVRPAELSEPSPLLQTTAADPFPAPPPALPAVDVLWTALPDAAGHARAVLSWPASPGAYGYTVWEAAEAALFHAVSGGGTPDTSRPLRARATDLKQRVDANQAVSLEAFSRLNERPLRMTSIELVLPGAADSLFAYRVSTVTAQNVESARSARIVLVGVPRRDVPAGPRLEASADTAAQRVNLIVVPRPGAPATALRVHRIRTEYLSRRVGTMGPPVIGPVALSSLTPVTVPALSGPPSQGFAFTDAVAGSWQPYFYCAVATGKDVPADGIRAGDSAPSGVVRILVPPAKPPLIANLQRTTSPAAHRIDVMTDLPWSQSPAGSGTIALAVVNTSGGAPARTVIGSFVSHAIAEGTPQGPPVTAASATRSAVTGGKATVSLVFPPVSGPVVLTLTDPLGRSASVEVV